MKGYSITALCLCTIIGAGFATGRELITYFVCFGIYGFAGIAAASLLFTSAIYLILKSPCRSIDELTKKRLPYALAFLANKIIFVFLIVLYSGMLAASAEIFSLLLGIDKMLCGIASALLCLTIILIGTSALTQLSQILFIPMLLIIFIISGKAVGVNIAAPPENIFTFRTLASPVIYLSYNMITAIALIVTLPKVEKPMAIAVQTGLCIFVLTTVLALPLYTHYSSIYNMPLPIMALLENGSALKYMYILFLLFAIFTTAVSNGYSAVCYMDKRSGRLSASCIITAVAYLLSLVGFAEIVDKVYFIFGAAGILLLFAL